MRRVSEGETIKVSAVIPQSPNRIYGAWLDERLLQIFSGSRAVIQPWAGGRFHLGDGYIEGSILEVDIGRLIVMAWRTTDFPSEWSDSRVEIHLDPVAGGTQVNLQQVGVPDGQSDKYKRLWKNFFLEPMRKFFAQPSPREGMLKIAADRKVTGSIASERDGIGHIPSNHPTSGAMVQPPVRIAAPKAPELEPVAKTKKSEAPKAAASKSTAPKSAAPKAPAAKAPAAKPAAKLSAKPAAKPAAKPPAKPTKSTAPKGKSVPPKRASAKPAAKKPGKK